MRRNSRNVAGKKAEDSGNTVEVRRGRTERVVSHFSPKCIVEMRYLVRARTLLRRILLLTRQAPVLTPAPSQTAVALIRPLRRRYRKRNSKGVRSKRVSPANFVPPFFFAAMIERPSNYEKISAKKGTVGPESGEVAESVPAGDT